MRVYYYRGHEFCLMALKKEEIGKDIFAPSHILEHRAWLFDFQNWCVVTSQYVRVVSINVKAYCQCVVFSRENFHMPPISIKVEVKLLLVHFQEETVKV